MVLFSSEKVEHPEFSIHPVRLVLMEPLPVELFLHREERGVLNIKILFILLGGAFFAPVDLFTKGWVLRAVMAKPVVSGSRVSQGRKRRKHV